MVHHFKRRTVFHSVRVSGSDRCCPGFLALFLVLRVVFRVLSDRTVCAERDSKRERTLVDLQSVVFAACQRGIRYVRVERIYIIGNIVVRHAIHDQVPYVEQCVGNRGAAIVHRPVRARGQTNVVQKRDGFGVERGGGVGQTVYIDGEIVVFLAV